MIIETGQRTDIPAFYAEWFCNRLREGYVLVRNPFDPESVSRYSLDPSLVDVLGFCTKNPEPMLKYMDQLRPYHMYWHVTITPYGREIELNVPDREKVMESFCKLSGIVGAERMAWRYDPIFLNETYTVERHLEEFRMMAKTLSGYTGVCVISFIDRYEKVKRNFPEVKTVPREARIEMGKAMIAIAKENGMVLRPCAEGDELARYGADCRGCMTAEIWEQAAGCRLNFPSRKPNRKECSCFISGDIGQYDTCGHFCRYCYANASREKVVMNMKSHDPNSPLLVGHLKENDRVHEVSQRSWADRQMSLFDYDFL